MRVEVAIQLGNGGNDRMHWTAAQRKKRIEKDAVGWALRAKGSGVTLPVVVTITRIAPSNGLDDDNLAGACKYVRDSVASWLGVDDKHSDRVRYAYAQERGPWGVRIEIS